MTDIFIKSFNRAFYLDRCLYSIEKFVFGDYQVTILDDGTPEKYLKKIKEKYPHIEIKTSRTYQQKIKAIEENINTGKEIDGFQIPTDLWIEAAQNASEYFIMTEDDVWFIANIHVDKLAETANNKNISLIKLGWLGNYKDDESLNIKPINEILNATVPKDLFLSSPLIMDWFFYNKYKFFTIGYRLKLFDNHTKLKYWSLNSILMGFWQKEYWLSVWKDAKGKVDEKQQLRNAANFYRKHKHDNFVTRHHQEIMKTTFQSSATNSYHQYGYDVDINYINYLLNEHWYHNQLDAQENFPKDFTLEYFESFFDQKMKKEEYRKWVEQFRNQYKNLGCDVG